MQVTYDPLPTVTDADEAMRETAPRLHEGWPDNVAARREILTGDPDSAFASAHTVVEATFRMPRQAAAPLEGRATCASFDPDTGELTVWASSQAPHQYRTVMAATLGMETASSSSCPTWAAGLASSSTTIRRTCWRAWRPYACGVR
jgi:CO/xanthine dehydrogenase Mo-binding subunit